MPKSFTQKDEHFEMVTVHSTWNHLKAVRLKQNSPNGGFEKGTEAMRNTVWGQKAFLTFLFLIFLDSTAQAATNRITPIPTTNMKQMITRFSVGSTGRANFGNIICNQFFPTSSFSMGALGTTDCSYLLDEHQKFPLNGMLESGYIDEDTHRSLAKSSDYLYSDQVTFFRVYSDLTTAEFKQHEQNIGNDQIINLPLNPGSAEQLISVTLGTAFLVNGHRLTPEGKVKAPLPWMKDPTFEAIGSRVLNESNGLVFEFGRAMQRVPGTLDFNIDAALITILHEISIHRASYEESLIFIHSYARANTLLYQRKFPTLKVIATDPENPENVILATPVAPLLSSADRPWSHSGPIQALRAIDPEHVTVAAAWNFITAMRNSGRIDFDYTDSAGQLGRTPVVMRLPFWILSNLLIQQARKMGLKTQEQADQLVSLFNHKLQISEDGVDPELVDPVAASAKFFHSNWPMAVTFSNFDQKELARDPSYVLRVFFSGILNYGDLLYRAGLHGVTQTEFVFTTTDEDIAKALSNLGPTKKQTNSFSSNWRIKNKPSGSIFKYTEGTATSFYFTFQDADRIAKAHLPLFEQMKAKSALNPGFFQCQALLSRPTGL